MYSTKITDVARLAERAKGECAKIDGHVDLLRGVHENFAKAPTCASQDDGNHNKFNIPIE